MDPPIGHDTKYMRLNRKLIAEYGSCKMVSNILKIRKKYKFIANIYHDNKIILKLDYIVLGSYSKEKNFWIWYDQSLVIHKYMINKIRSFRSKILKDNITEKIKNFIDTNYSVLPSDELYDNLSQIEESRGNHVITLKKPDDENIIIVLMIKKILFDSTV